MPLVWVSSIFNLDPLSGIGVSIILSNLPGLNNAVSIISGRLVAAMITTSCRSSSPSSSVSIWLTTRSVTWASELALLLGANESSSSKKIIVGDVCLAFLKISLTAFSDSPTHFESSSGPLTSMKLDFDSFATAFASMVFPVPGAP